MIITIVRTLIQIHEISEFILTNNVSLLIDIPEIKSIRSSQRNTSLPLLFLYVYCVECFDYRLPLLVNRRTI